MIPFLSIIIPLYNKQKCILKTLNSVLTQDYNDYEIIIVDDGSTDDSVAVIKGLLNNQIHLYQKENGGPSSARNYGVRMAQGKWVLFLDADDTLDIDALAFVTKVIKKHRLADVYCFNLFMEQNNHKSLFVSCHKKGYLLFPFLYWYQGRIYPRTGNMVCKRSIMLNEPFREDYSRWEDAENTFRLMRKYRFYAAPLPIFTYCRDTMGASLPRKNLTEDFSCNLQPKGKSLFEVIAQYKLYRYACDVYSKEVIEERYGNTFKKRYIKRIVRMVNLLGKTSRA